PGGATARGCATRGSAGRSSRWRSAASPGASRSMIEAVKVRRLRSCAPSPPSSGGEGRGEGLYPRVLRLRRHPSPRPSPRKSGARERGRRALAVLLTLLFASSPAFAQSPPRQPLTIGYVEIANDPRYEPIRGADRIVLKTRAHPYVGAEVSIDDAAPLHRVLPVD